MRSNNTNILNNMNINVNANNSVTSSTKYPLVYIFKIKRGVSWSNRRIEMDKDRLKYFKTGIMKYIF
jgi:hypothetical protein